MTECSGQSAIQLRKRGNKTPHTKSRKGCLTCKTRHLKCDETQPKCLRCVKNGYKCDGYARHLPIEFWHPVPRNFWAQFYDGHEKICMQFFLDITVDWLSNAKPCANFWNPFCLQILHSEPAIKHIALAIGSSHRIHWDDSCNAVKERAFYLKHYERGLSLLNGMVNPELDLILVCCLLFCVLECFRFREEAFDKHMYAGINILRDFERKPAMTSTSSEERIRVYISPVFNALELHSVDIKKHALLCRKERPSVAFEQLMASGKIPISRNHRALVGPQVPEVYE